MKAGPLPCAAPPPVNWRRSVSGSATLRLGGDVTMDSRRTLKAVAADPALAVGSSMPRDALFKGGEFWGLPLDEESVPVTKAHLLRCQLAREALERWLEQRGLEGYVGSDESLYWDRSNVRRVLQPDVFVAIGASSGPRRNYRIWAEGPTPCFVLECLSPSTRRRDLGEKKAIYEEIGIPEYFIHEGEDDEDTDGTRRRGPRIDPPLQGFRLRRLGRGRPRYEPIPARRGVSYPAPDVSLGYASESLGLDVTFAADRDGVRFFDAASNAFVLTPAEAAEARAETAETRAAAAEARVAELERLLAQGDN